MINARHRWSIVLIAGGLLAATTSAWVLADDDDEDHERHEHHNRRGDLAAAPNPLYREECGGCHMAYPAGLLPAADWARLLTPAALTDHFGDDATLPEETRTALADYLAANAADQGRGPRADAFARGGAASADGLPRISDGRYFRKEHDEIPARLVADNPAVGSFSKCNACHRNAEVGDFSERSIDIPGYGRWED